MTKRNSGSNLLNQTRPNPTQLMDEPNHAMSMSEIYRLHGDASNVFIYNAYFYEAFAHKRIHI